MLMEVLFDFVRFVLIPSGIICGALCYGLAKQRGHPKWGCWIWAFMGFFFTFGGLIGALFLPDENEK